MFENDDDYDFNPLESSKLSSLFGSPQLQSEGTTKNLIYTAPKQPSATKTKPNNDKPATTKVIAIKIVTLWKSEAKTYKPLGKHGLAVIGATDIKAYELIAYKHKTDTVLRAKINGKFQFQQRKDNFSSFYDNSGQNWLVRFDSAEQQTEFSESLKSFGANLIIEDDGSSKLVDGGKDSDTDSVKKANILSRITKMGQQVVPKPLEVVESDISDEYEGGTGKNRKFKKIKKLEDAQIVTRAHVSLPQVYYPDMNSIIIAQNTELKSSLNQISEKLDSLNLQKKDSNSEVSSRVKVLELKLENLETELGKYKQKCSDLESKLQENSSLAEKLLEANIKVENYNKLQNLLEEKDKVIQELKETVETQKQSLDELNACCQQYIETIRESSSKIMDLNGRILKYEELETGRVQGCNEKVQVLSRLVKEQMNEMYQSALNAFDPEENYSLNEIQSVLSKNLKDASYKIINDVRSELGDVKDGTN